VNPRPPGWQANAFARRGQSYGARTDARGASLDQLPDADVGLLFMALNADIARQFVAMQQAANHPYENDPVIGQTPHRPPLSCPITWGGLPTDVRPAAPFPPAVTMRGGEYFFLPSLSFLTSLEERATA
jgi:hypothetical protein